MNRSIATKDHRFRDTSSFKISSIQMLMSHWRIQDFPRRGRQPSVRGPRDTILLKFPKKLHEIEKKLVAGRAHARSAPPWIRH